MSAPVAAGASRRRLARTLSGARWDEYADLLDAAAATGYEVVSLESWVVDGDPGPRVLILRHDVDQHPRSALPMAAIEEAAGVRSTWYFRWRTAHAGIIGSLAGRGFGVGLHYETLTRRQLRRGSPRGEPASLVEECRSMLRAEIAAFSDRFGTIRSIAPHGDSRVPEVNNGVLMRDEDPSAYDIDFDGNEAMRGRRLGHWLTDRSATDGGWRDGVQPRSLLERGTSPILCLTHPNNWASGGSLWADRVLQAVLPWPAPARPIRTGRDDPRL